MAELPAKVDLVITPTGHLGAPPLAELDQLRPVAMLASLHTPYWNPLGNPTLAVPIGTGSDGMSMSISGNHFDEATVLRGRRLSAPHRPYRVVDMTAPTAELPRTATLFALRYLRGHAPFRYIRDHEPQWISIVHNLIVS